MRDQFPFPSLMRHPVSFLKHSLVLVTHCQTERAISWYSFAYSEKPLDRILTHGCLKWWRCEQACNKWQNTDDGHTDGLWKVGWSAPPDEAVIRWKVLLNSVAVTASSHIPRYMLSSPVHGLTQRHVMNTLYSSCGTWWHTVTHGRGSEGETGEWSW